MEGLIHKLANDPELRRQGEALKLQLLDDPRLAQHMHRLWAELSGRLQTRGFGDMEGLEDKAQALLQVLGGWLRNDTRVQQMLNTGARTLVRQVLAPQREQIGRFVAQVVEGWDAQGVVERLELQVGPDLQYIRVNGTLVGGLVGLVLFALSRALRLG